jgi:catechol 2,3-dioxygenase-like lactoylglutathione lyase family enzyme
MGITSGVHHVALGVRDLEGIRSFYQDVMGCGQGLQEIEKERASLFGTEEGDDPRVG